MPSLVGQQDETNEKKCVAQFQASGVYIFRPLSSEPERFAEAPSIAQLTTSHFTETLVTMEWASFIVRNWETKSPEDEGAVRPEAIEIEWMVGPIPGTW